MNLKAMRAHVKNLVDYSPELQSFNDQLDALLNDAYMELWTMKRWSFATKELLFKFYPDILPNRDIANVGAFATEVEATVVKGSRQVVFSRAIDRLVPEVWEGQIIELSGIEYKISKVVTNAEILLDKQFVSDSITANTTWIIKKRWYDLPEDCAELLYLGHEETPASGSSSGARGKIQAITPRVVEERLIKDDHASTYADFYIPSPAVMIPAAEKAGISNIRANQLLPPSGFPAESYLEVCWCFERNGKRGPLSEPVVVQMGDEQGAVYNFDIQFLSYDDQPIVADPFQTKDKFPTQYEGFRKIVFWNSNYNRTDGERLGLPCWLEFNSAGSVRSTSTYLDTMKAQDTDAFISIIHFSSIDPGNERYVEHDGQHLQIRPYPRIDGFDLAVTQSPSGTYSAVPEDFYRFGTIRYYKKPRKLAKASDAPDMPWEFHQLIVYKALVDIYAKLGQSSMSEMYRRKIDKERKDLEKRYVSRSDAMIRKGSYDSTFGINGWRLSDTINFKG